MKAGQKYPTPQANDPLLRFYKSLFEQNKESKMAIKWCFEHGVFSKAKAEELDVLFKLENLKIKKYKNVKKVLS